MIDAPQHHVGRRAVVTGAARGIGQAIAVGLAARGADVVAIDIVTADETVARAQARGGRCQAAQADVSDPDQVTDVAARATAAGAVDIVVNNAGIHLLADIADLEYEDWRRVLAVNLDSMFLVSKAFVGPMRQQAWGRIVNIASNSPSLNLPGAAAYITSKMGVIGLTRSMANDLAADGITVNAIAPTLTVTPAVSHLGADDFDAVAQLQAIRRPGRPEDLVGTVSYLCTDDAAFVTAQTLVVDGGLARTSV